MTRADLEAARLLLARMGITPEQLITTQPTNSQNMPTLREHIQRVTEAIPVGTRRTYDTYWRHITDALGDHRIDKPTPLEIAQPCETLKSHVTDKKLTAGEYSEELLTWLVKKGPAAGIVVMLATQRPDATTIPSGLRAVVGPRFALPVMDWRDSNIVLGEQMNTHGYDSSRLFARLGILRPDGHAHASPDVVALTVRTDYMPNENWQTICQRSRALHETEYTLTGHSAGEHLNHPELDHAAAARPTRANAPRSDGVPQPLAAIVDHLDRLLQVPQFLATAELAELLDFDPAWLGRRLAELGCQSTRERVTSEDGRIRQIRGYLTTDLLTTATALRHGQAWQSSDGTP